MKRFILAVVLLQSLFGVANSADTLEGKVAEVDGKVVKIRFESLPEIGSRLEVVVDVPDIGEAIVGTLVVTDYQKNFIVATIDQSSGKIGPGQKVRPAQKSSPTVALRPTAPLVPPAIPASPGSVDPRDTRFPPWPTVRPGQTWLGESRWPVNLREVVLCGVLKDGPAGKAGLQVDDSILYVDGTRVRDSAGLQKAVEAHSPGETAVFEIERDGKRLTVPVVLEAIPPDGGNGRILAAAEAGESWAMMDIGVRYANFRRDVSYFEQDDAEAVKWFQRATDAGYTAGPWFLGLMYHSGKGVERDYVQAARLYEQARLAKGDGVRKGLIGAATNELAGLYLGGFGVPKDPVTAARLYQEAADTGNPFAIYKLGTLYKRGTGVEKNLERALQLFRVAAHGDLAVAQCALGRMYAEEAGVARDDEKAALWFRRAADKGNAEAQDYLAFLYAAGRGVPKSNDEAVHWYRAAARQGYAHAVELLKKLGVPY